MKKIRNYALSSLSALCLLSVSCSEENTPTPPPDNPVFPAVSFAPDYRVDGTSVTFTLQTVRADRAAYLLVQKQADVPTATEVLDEGKPLSGKESYTVTEDNLGMDLDYIVYAAAANGKNLSEVASLEFSTGVAYDDLLTLTEVGKNYISYHIEAEPQATFRHVALLKKFVENFTTGVQTDQQYAQRIQMLLSIYGMEGRGPLDFTLHDMDLRPNGQPYDVMAGMSYTVLACRTDAAGNYVGQNSLQETVTSDPEDNGLSVAVEIVDVQSGEAIVRCTPDQGLLYIIEQPFPKALVEELLTAGGEHGLLEYFFTVAPRTTEFGKPSEWAFLNPQTEYIHLVMGVDAQGDRTALIRTPFTTPEEPEVDVNTENLDFGHPILSYYYGQWEDDKGNPSYNFYFLLATESMSPDEYGEPYPAAFPCHAINCDLYAVKPSGDELILPDGIYTFGDTHEAGTWSSDSWAAYFDEQEELYELLPGEGTITVERTGTDYHIVIDMKMEKGKVYTGSYTGPLTFEDRSSSPFSTGKSRWTASAHASDVHAPLRR